MSEETLILIGKILLKHGPDIAVAFARLFRPGATIDDAINALSVAEAKTAQDYRADTAAAKVIQG